MSTAAIDEAIADTSTEAQGNKPVKTFRHRALSASVFENATKQGDRTFHSVTIQRAYKVDGEYRHSSSFTRDELPVVEHLLKQAWLFMLEADSKQQDDSEK